MKRYQESPAGVYIFDNVTGERIKTVNGKAVAAMNYPELRAAIDRLNRAAE